MNPGALRHRIEIQEQSGETDAAGQPLREWATVARRWASVEPIIGREYFAAQERQAEVSTRIRMRYFEPVRARMRVVWRGRWYDIVSVIHSSERDTETQLMCNQLEEKPL